MLRVGRYLVFEPIGAGGMASVHVGRMLGPLGFSRTVAVKRLHPHLIEDGAFVTMLVEEARIASRIQHPAVIQTIDIVSEQGEVLLVMEYLHGESLAKLLRTATAQGDPVPLPIAATIAAQMLRGLHAAHEVTGEGGRPLDLVHRDVSPQNVLLGEAGEVKVIDFGVAKALGRAPTTRAGQVKGKLSYLSPEQLLGQSVDRRADVFAAGIVLWEMIVGARLFGGDDARETYRRIASCEVPSPSASAPGRDVDPELEAIVMKALARQPEDRYPTAAAMADALEARGSLASSTQVGGWVVTLCGASLEQRRARIAGIEREGAPLEATGAGEPATSLTADDATRSSLGSAVDVSVPRDASRRRRIAWGLVALVTLAALFAVAVTAGGGRGAPVTAPSASVSPESNVAAPPPNAASTSSPEPALAPPVSVPAASSADGPAAPRATVKPGLRPHAPASSIDCRNPPHGRDRPRETHR